MQTYNLCYVLCKSCTKALCIENANWWFVYAKMRSAMCYLQKKVYIIILLIIIVITYIYTLTKTRTKTITNATNKDDNNNS